jgi:hypothetical protein
MMITHVRGSGYDSIDIVSTITNGSERNPVGVCGVD